MGEIHFDRKLAPGGEKSIIPVCNAYKPTTQNEFYSEIERALSNGVKFVLCLIDVHFTDKSKVIPLIEFCKKNNIEIINFDYVQIVATGRKTPDEIKKHLPEDTTTIIKETLSIFSSPETHECLRSISPDALIFAGEIAGCCVKASAMGFGEESMYYCWHGEEFGAVQYGYPIYTQKDLIFDDGYPEKDYQNLDHPLIYKFKSIAENKTYA
ncbi:hypothetical protein GZ78_01015 [Endozoicomonas numazuensis]|uniref:Uncharacterized protein n=2 Tax=Endozoicomonas numazuensis TaxID=1137799 RepID=A0A081NJU9_9GAMM|nr:hypothetical protein GZ78_01015 [Endozoicomonas numazuensis]